MTERITADEMVESLTGYDEIAIEKHFGAGPFQLVNSGRETSLMRALVFIQLRRGGQPDHEAKEAVMQLPLKEVQARFAEDDFEPMPDEPVTDSGKGA